MRRVETRYLSDGRFTNDGRPMTLLEIETPADLDALYDRIVDTNFYDSGYFDRYGYRTGLLPAHFYFVAELARSLRPRRVLEVGCGRGDVLRLLAGAGVEVAGVDVSEDVLATAWPSVREGLRCGDLVEVLEQWSPGPPAPAGASSAAGASSVRPGFDLVCGFDIWEHLRPSGLDRALRAAVAVSSEDAFFYFVVPAFGADEVFGEPFPLEFEENREDHAAGRPYRFLPIDSTRPDLPALGHLTLAPSAWWLDRFTAAGLVRLPDHERAAHRFLDPHLPHSVRACYLLRRDTPAAAARAAATPAFDRVAYSRSVWRLLARRSLPDGPLRLDPDIRRSVVADWRGRLGRLARDRSRRLVGRFRPA